MIIPDLPQIILFLSATLLLNSSEKRVGRIYVLGRFPYLRLLEHMGAVRIDERPMVTLPGQMAPIMKFVIPKE